MRISSRLFTAAVILFSAGVSVAQDAPESDAGAPSIEDRRAAREARRSEWESMSEDERAAVRAERRQRMEARRAQARERYENMSEEERQAMREQRQQRRESMDGHRPGGFRGAPPRRGQEETL